MTGTRVTVAQDAQGIDMEDRIVKMKAYLAGRQP